MTIENLIKGVSPPPVPVEPFDGPWEPIETELGTPLPQDYKDFVRLYGSGRFMEFLAINVPRCRNPHVRFESEIRVAPWLLQGVELPYPLWPSPDGLIPLGTTDNGDHLFWLARGALEDWDVVVWGRGMQTFETFDCGLTDFLAGLATREILPEEFPEELLSSDHLFRPFSDSPPREDPPEFTP